MWRPGACSTWGLAWWSVWVSVGFLRPLSWLYAALFQCHRGLYRLGWRRSAKPQAFTLVVGNVLAGGTGKTPIVVAIVRHLHSRGWTVGVVSGAYGRQSRQCLEVQADTPIQDSGDEPALIKRLTAAPVFVARQRLQAAQALLQAYPQTQVIVCDDGLQHWALQRDLEVVVFDERGLGNGLLLPAGPLRETWPRRHNPCPQLVLQNVWSEHLENAPNRDNKADNATSSTNIHSSRALCRSTPPLHNSAFFLARRTLAPWAYRPKHPSEIERIDLQHLPHRQVQAIAGIAQPEVFFAMLRQAGVDLAATWALPDHDGFAQIPPACLQAPWLLCTEKDAPKLWPLHPKAWAVPLQVHIDAGFFHAIEQALAHHTPPDTPSPQGHSHHGQQIA